MQRRPRGHNVTRCDGNSRNAPRMVLMILEAGQYISTVAVTVTVDSDKRAAVAAAS